MGLWINVTGWTPGMPIDQAMELVRDVWPPDTPRCKVVMATDADILAIKPDPKGLSLVGVPFALLRANLAIQEADER